MLGLSTCMLFFIYSYHPLPNVLVSLRIIAFLAHPDLHSLHQTRHPFQYRLLCSPHVCPLALQGEHSSQMIFGSFVFSSCFPSGPPVPTHSHRFIKNMRTIYFLAVLPFSVCGTPLMQAPIRSLFIPRHFTVFL